MIGTIKGYTRSLDSSSIVLMMIATNNYNVSIIARILIGTVVIATGVTIAIIVNSNSNTGLHSSD